MTDEEIEEMFCVEGTDFLEELKSKKYVQLNEEGIEKVVKIIEEFEDKLQRIENYLDRQHDVPIEILVNIKNIIHSESDSDGS